MFTVDYTRDIYVPTADAASQTDFPPSDVSITDSTRLGHLATAPIGNDPDAGKTDDEEISSDDFLNAFSGATRELFNAYYQDPKKELKWGKDELRGVTPENLPFVIDVVGKNLTELDLAAGMLDEINLAHCPNLKVLRLRDETSPIVLKGLAKCTKLEKVDLSGSWLGNKADKEKIMTALNEIPNEAIEIFCYGSGLMIESYEDAEKQFAPDGPWGKFLDKHPKCAIEGLVDVPEHVRPQEPAAYFLLPNLTSERGFIFRSVMFSGRVTIFGSERKCKPEDLSPIEIEGVEIRDRDQLSILKRYSPEAQRCIVRNRLLDPGTKNVPFGGDELAAFFSDEIRLLLRDFGEKFSRLNFFNYPGLNSLRSIDLGHCINLEEIYLDNLLTLKYILNLPKCEKLQCISFRSCKRLDKEKTMEQLAQIDNPSIEIIFKDSSLMIDSVKELETQFSPGGIWDEFFKFHPTCTLEGLFDTTHNDPLLSACKQLAKKRGLRRPPYEDRWWVSANEPTNYYGIAGSDPASLQLIKEFGPDAQDMILNVKLLDPRTKKLKLGAPILDSFMAKEVPALLNRFGEKIVELDFTSYEYRSRLESIDVSHCINLEILRCSGLRYLQRIEGLNKCEKLQYLSLIKCTALDEKQIMLGLICLPPGPNIKIDCHASNLVIQTPEAVQEKLGRGGVWGPFLQLHPACQQIRGLIDQPSAEANELLKPHGFVLKEDLYSSTDQIVPIQTLGADARAQ